MNEMPLGLRQLRALNNPVRIELLTLLRSSEPLTAAQIAARLGIEEHLIYYHLAQMTEVGLIQKSGARPGSTKPETLYAAGPPSRMEGLDYEDEQTRREITKNVSTVLSTAAKEYAKAIEVRRQKADEECSLFRLTAMLSEDERRELSAKLREITAWLHERQQGDGNKYSVTIAISSLTAD
ncbi:MAG: helix-turn-helix transcriptional regulator [Armatimonadetes bacterium]|nr:helix-turn-helix transcriptional regulator [Armatimonadota bacterium]